MRTAPLLSILIVVLLNTAMAAAEESSEAETPEVASSEVASPEATVPDVASPEATVPSPAQPRVYDDPPSRWAFHGKLADPWTLPQPEFLEDRGITVGGWLEGGIYGNQYGATDNGPIGLRSIGDGFTMDQAWLYAERKTDTQGCGWDLGGRIDYLFGVDGPQTQAFGDRTWDFGWNTSPQYGFAMPQLYAEVAYNDLKVKIGHFYTPIGYEVVQAPQNFFYSHSYSHTFGEPFTHTGFLGDYACTEKVHVYGGWVDGWDEGFAGRDGGSMFLGGTAWTLSDKTTLAWYCSAGRLGNGTAFGRRGLRRSLLPLPGADAQDHREVDVRPRTRSGNELRREPAATGVDNQWYGINNYVSYKINDCWSYGGRVEVVPGSARRAGRGGRSRQLLRHDRRT